MKNTIQQILERTRGCRILVAGDIMIDVYDFCYTEHSRPSPESPEKFVYTANRSERMLGGAGNVAANISSLGAQAWLLSICGDDGNALEARRLCETAGVRHSLSTDFSRPTTIKTRLYIDDHYLLRRDNELVHSVSTGVAAEICSEFARALEHVDAVIFSDYHKGFFTPENAQNMIVQCRQKNIPVIVDLKPANRGIFCGATVIAPNLKEAKEIFPAFNPAQAYDSMSGIYAVLGANEIAVTLGADGIMTFDGKTVTHIAGKKVAAVDPCGCGDTVRACLTLGLVSGLALPAAAEFANYAASLVIQKLGTATLAPDELLENIS
ncbi:MAG: PfkB family carbohydrate kinase [Kiritimatiellales bacterium]